MTDLLLIKERDARDRITDRLGLGRTAPIQNLPLPAELPLVAFNTPASIPLVYSQPDTLYWPTTGPCEAAPARSQNGTGAALALDTAAITDTVIYGVCACKGGQGKCVGLPLRLNGQVRVRPGLNQGLAARVVLAPDDAEHPVRLLDPALPPPYPDQAPRLIRFNSAVLVQVDGAQAGVRYTLEDEAGAILSVGPVNGEGPGRSIEIRSLPLTEDVTLVIRAVLIQDPTNQTLLNARLSVKVMANAGLTVTPLYLLSDYAAEGVLRVGQTQKSATYQVFARPIPDREYRPDRSRWPDDRISDPIPIPDGEPVPVLLPDRFLEWPTPDGTPDRFAPFTEARQGNGGTLEITLPAAHADQVLLIRAAKSHTRADGDPIPSAVRLAQAHVQLVRPDPAPQPPQDIRLSLDPATGDLTFHGGEPGVFYDLTLAGGVELPVPAYVHQRDPDDPDQNKGIEALAVGVDLVPTRDPPEPPADPVRTPPLPPLLANTGLADGDAVSLRAVKAQTGLAQPLAAAAIVHAAAE